MWLCTQRGFYSIVQKRRDEYHIRSRTKQDLQNLRGLGGFDWRIVQTKNADYRWRVIATAADVLKVMSALGSDIDYANFKARIHELPDQDEKSFAYSALWGNLYRLQQ